MKCPKCSAENTDSQKFCGNCGKELKKKEPGALAGCLTLIILCVFFFFACGGPSTKDSNPATADSPKVSSSAENIEQQQAAFNAWYSSLEQKLKIYDGIWGAYQKIMNELANGELSRYEAYSKLNHIKDLQFNNQHDIWKMEAPKGLNKEHQELLNDATSNLSTAGNTRCDAIKHTMEFIDNPKPSKQQEALDDIKLSDSFALKAAANIAKVREELNIPEPQQKQE